jgi:hypothetical protein
VASWSESGVAPGLWRLGNFTQFAYRIIDRKGHIPLSLSKRPVQRPSLRLSSPRYIKHRLRKNGSAGPNCSVWTHDPRFLATEQRILANTPISPEEIRKCQTKSGSKHLKTAEE